MKQIVASKEHPNQLKYKVSFKDDYEILITRKNKTHLNLNRSILQKAYSTTQGLPAEKLKDLLTLCGKNIIPSKYHNYYNSMCVCVCVCVIC